MFAFTENDIRQLTTAQSFDRGEDYYHSGAVMDLVRRGHHLTARVAGSQFEPYRVDVTLTEDGHIASAVCTCPYDWGGYCKHIVAVLLAALHKKVEERPPLETLLAPLTADQLRSLLLDLTEDYPELIEAVEKAVEAVVTPTRAATPSPARPAPSIPYDLTAIQREISKDLSHVGASFGYGRRRYEYDYWEEEPQLDADAILGPHVQLVTKLLDAGEAEAATEVLMTIIEAWADGIEDLPEWVYEYNQDTIAEAGEDLAVFWAEVLLSQDLSPEERDEWLEELDDWEDRIPVDIVRTALETWWDSPPLVAVLRGQGIGEGGLLDFADPLTSVWLRILERQGRRQEYIHLARAAGRFGLYVNMLARVGRVAEAVQEARVRLTNPNAFLELASILAEGGHTAAALEVAAAGLEHGDIWQRRELAEWTTAQAEAAGDTALALRAAETAFSGSLALDAYQRVQRLAGAQWPEIRDRLLAELSARRDDRAVPIFLYEGMLQEAMAAVERSFYDQHLEAVVQATRQDYPDWGIRQYQNRAERIMNAADAKHYDAAAGWLRRAREIYLQHGRQAEWERYLNQLLQMHARKYKLVPLLRALF